METQKNWNIGTMEEWEEGTDEEREIGKTERREDPHKTVWSHAPKFHFDLAFDFW